MPFFNYNAGLKENYEHYHIFLLTKKSVNKKVLVMSKINFKHVILNNVFEIDCAHHY